MTQRVPLRSVLADPSVLAEAMNPNELGKELPKVSRLDTLTDKDRMIIALVARGLKDKHIADRLGISERTVRRYLTSICRKLSIEGRFELIIAAFVNGLDKLPDQLSQTKSGGQKLWTMLNRYHGVR